MKKISLLILIFSAIVTISCTSDFEKLNTDPNNPRSVRADLLLAGTIRSTQTASYQMFGDNGAVWSQQLSTVEYVTEERYLPRAGSVNNTWASLYTAVVIDSKKLEEFAILENNISLEAISLIMQANAFQTLTDVYGPVPFSEAGIKGILKPKYDSQENVYKGINNMLIKADNLLATALNIVPLPVVPASVDLIFAGDLTKWRKFANSLRFRALMRIAKAPGVNNVAEIASVVSSGQLMSSNADTAKIFNLLDQANAHPFFATLANRLEYKASSVMVAKCNQYNDPRLAVFFVKNLSGNYVGNIPGTDSRNYPGTSGVGTFYKKADLSSILLSYSQVQLLLAEAANEGYIPNPIVTGTTSKSEEYMRNGITASFVYNGLTTVQATTYYNQSSLDYNIAADGRKVIGEQVWLSTFCQGYEPWIEWRRTGYPALLPVVNALESTIPGRYTYPQLEASVNQVNYAAASATLSAGDRLTSKVWWDVN